MDQGSEKTVKLQLLNEKGVQYYIKVSPEDAARANDDIMFATKLLNMHLAQQKECKLTSILAEDENDSIFKWSHEATLLLVEEYRLQEKHFTSGKMTHKKIWSNIATALSVKGYPVTGPQCLSKYNGMKRTYKSIKDHNAK
ncbi:unnamed protein product [Lasius platythorax]|uniref:Myb/SANT-like DNA-binding domain-containing protein n=1 Tax=Lasius platythorax TaxID=488582 RepID=A0AAV2MWG2_9HYME